MVDQKSENFRTLAGNHGGLRRGTAAAALGAVLVLSAGVPASNAAAPALLTDAGEGVQSRPDADAVPGAAPEADPTVSQVKATVDGTLSLEAWAGAILDDDDDESSAPPAPSASPTRPSFSPSSTPAPTAPGRTEPATPPPVTPTTSPAPAPAPSPTSTAASGTSPSQTAAPAPATSPSGYSPAASVPAPAAKQGPATQQAPAPESGARRLGPAVQPAPAQPAEAPADARVPATGSAAETPDRSAKGKLDTATSRPGAGITSGVWGSGRLSSPMNMGTVGSRYSVSRPSSAVLGSAQSAPASPLVWAGAGLVLVAGAAGLVAYKLRRAL